MSKDVLGLTIDYPMPPEPLIEAAMRAVPSVMADANSMRTICPPHPGAGQKLVPADVLVQGLVKRYRHGTAASVWAIHRLVERGMLTATGFGPRDSPELFWVESTPRLWEWWHKLEGDQTVQKQPKAPPSGDSNSPEVRLPDLPELLSASDLADRIDQPVARVETFLRRLREKDTECYAEVKDRRRNEPRFLYRTKAVWELLQEQSKKWSG